MSKSRSIYHKPTQQSRKAADSQAFRCAQCRRMVGPLPSGGRQRNHCPFCIYSLHVDGDTPGDRASDCNSRMAPVGKFARRNGEEVIVHRCLNCGFERYCRVGADDDWDAVAALRIVAAPSTS